jgi:hypothetical protein
MSQRVKTSASALVLTRPSQPENGHLRKKNTSLKLNLFYIFYICGCQHNQRKTICLYVYISDIRQIMGYRTPVFIQRFPWRLHIFTITYNLPHLRL